MKPQRTLHDLIRSRAGKRYPCTKCGQPKTGPRCVPCSRASSARRQRQVRAMLREDYIHALLARSSRKRFSPELVHLKRITVLAKRLVTPTFQSASSPI